MTKFEIYTLILCIIVFIMLVSLFSYMLTIIIKQLIKQIKAGLEDESIIKEFNNESAKRQSKFSKAFNVILNVFLCAVFSAFFMSSLYINCTQNVYFDNVPTYRVVLTSSMEEKNEKNTYLYSNDLDNQISAFDLIATYKLPKEEDLKLYDIVVYEVDGVLIIHRIVGIEEPNEKHPNERQFLLQGDANGSPDRFPVLYSQMKGIYKGEKIPYIGSFVLFLQSPAGWICMLLVVVGIIVTPILEKKLLGIRKARYLLIIGQGELALSQMGGEIVNQGLNIPKSNKTFLERLALSSKEMQQRYANIVQTLLRIDGIRLIEGKKQHSYKRKNICVARLLFRGKTLNVLLGLNPKDYEDSKYVFTDMLDTTKHKNYPMRIKLSSERQTRWTCDLILELANKNGLVVLQKVDKSTQNISTFEHLRTKRKSKTFKRKLRENPLARERFNVIKNQIMSIDGIRVIEGKYSVTYKLKNNPVAKILIKGKTLNVYIALNPSEYENSKYIFTDVSSVKKYVNYQMRLKVTSNRKVKHIKELISKVLQNL